jgi:hypothetical protein
VLPGIVSHKFFVYAIGRQKSMKNIKRLNLFHAWAEKWASV